MADEKILAKLKALLGDVKDDELEELLSLMGNVSEEDLDRLIALQAEAHDDAPQLMPGGAETADDAGGDEDDKAFAELLAEIESIDDDDDDIWGEDWKDGPEDGSEDDDAADAAADDDAWDDDFWADIDDPDRDEGKEINYGELVGENEVVLCAASAYEQKFYLNEDFGALPERVRQELQIMCVMYTEDVGGILLLVYDADGNLQLKVDHADNDFFFDDIGSVLKIRQLQNTKQELFESLEEFYKVFYLQ